LAASGTIYCTTKLARDFFRSLLGLTRGGLGNKETGAAANTEVVEPGARSRFSQPMCGNRAGQSRLGSFRVYLRRPEAGEAPFC
jgi:hypothetical protein